MPSFHRYMGGAIVDLSFTNQALHYSVLIQCIQFKFHCNSDYVSPSSSICVQTLGSVHIYFSK